MDQEFLNSRLFRHRLYFKTDISLSINPDLTAPGARGQPQPSPGGGSALWRPSGDKLVALTTKFSGPIVRIVTGLSFGY